MGLVAPPSAPRLVETRSDERHGARQLVLDDATKIAGAVRQRESALVRRRLRNDAPGDLRTLKRDQRDLRGTVPVVLNGIVLIIAVDSVFAVAAYALNA